jgi:hypothetical protein
VHVDHLVGDAVQPGDGQEQRHDQRHQDDERDQAAPKAAPGVFVVASAPGSFQDDGSLGVALESTRLVGVRRHARQFKQ